MPPRKRKAAVKPKEPTPTKKSKQEDSPKAKVFRRKGNQIFTDLCALLPEFTLELELVKGVRGAFEIYCRKIDNEEEEKGVLVWTGVKKGPPRKEKFPEASALVDDVKKVFK
ncbi:BthD [Sergentomyia squamirostris]